MRFNMNVKRMGMVVAAIAMLGTGSALASEKAPAPRATEINVFQVYASSRASTLLTEIQTEAARLNNSAETLATLNYRITWPSHATYLLQVKDHINAVGERLRELQQIHSFVLPWQQQAIDEMNGHALQVAASAQAAIAHLHANQDRTFAPNYQNHLRIIMGNSENLKQTVDKFLNYDQVEQKFQELRNELEL
jgi:hypothetical protein